MLGGRSVEASVPWDSRGGSIGGGGCVKAAGLFIRAQIASMSAVAVEVVVGADFLTS